MRPTGTADATLLWLPAGVALAGLLRWGCAVWPGIALGSAAALLASGASPGLAAALAFGHTAGPLVGVGVLRRLRFQPRLTRRDDLWRLGVGVAASGLLSAANGVGWRAAQGLLAPSQVGAALWRAWGAETVGGLLVGIVLLALSRKALQRLAGRDGIVTLALAFATVACGLLGFWTRSAGTPRVALVFVPFLLACVLALRAGILTASASVLLVTLVAAYASARGHGPFAQAAGSYAVLLWAYGATLPVAPLLLGTLAAELRGSQGRWKLALDGSHIGVAHWSVGHGHIALSRRWLSLLGHRKQSFGTRAEKVWEFTHEDDRLALEQALEALRRKGRDHASATWRMRCADGRWKWLAGHAIVTERCHEGEPSHVVLTARDIDEQRAAEERQQLHAHLFEQSHEGLLVVDGADRVVDVNAAYCAISGSSRDELLGGVASLLRPAAEGSDAERQRAALREGLRSTGHWRGEMIDQRRNGETCTLQVTASSIASPHGPARFHAFAVVDVTQARLQRAQLERQAHCDELTGLPNRSQLAHLMREAMQTSEREGYLLTVCYLDLDHFKPVNDRYGHEAGDRLIVDLAERLRRSLRRWRSGDDAVARLGGDEFVLLLRTATLDESRHAVERLMRNIAQPYALGVGAGPLSVTVSIGATVYPVDNADADTLLRHASHAMYGAKQAGRNGYLFFDAEHDRRTVQQFEAMGRVQDAIDADQFTLHYQPKVDMRAGRVLGMEALLRWSHPQHGLILPGQFLPLVEQTALGTRLGDWVLQQGIEQLARWQRMGLDITVSVNISARHLQEPHFAARLAALVGRHTTPVAQRLVIEVLESAALADIDYTRELMDQCRELGVRFALDDFGTGYSTFTYLKRLPLDFLKIDRSFVHNMLADRQDLAIVEGVIALSQTFGCKVVAEGVESADQAQRLIELGCDVGQGHGIAKAMPAAQVYDWVRGYRSAFAAPQRVEAT